MPFHLKRERQDFSCPPLHLVYSPRSTSAHWFSPLLHRLYLPVSNCTTWRSSFLWTISLGVNSPSFLENLTKVFSPSFMKMQDLKTSLVFLAVNSPTLISGPNCFAKAMSDQEFMIEDVVCVIDSCLPDKRTSF